LRRTLSAALGLFIILLPATAWAQPASAPLSASDDRAVREVLDAFAAAIVAKDRSAFARLVLTNPITFASALDARTLADVRRRRADAVGFEIGSWSAFVEFVATSPDRLEERFSNVVIQGDGTIATLYFDYAFVENGLVTNDGHESWGLLKTGDGWKIASVIWSVSTPAP